MTYRAPLVLSPPATSPNASNVWPYTPPRSTIPSSGRSSDLLGTGLICKPPFSAAPPWDLPFFPDGSQLDATTIAFLNGRQTGVSDGTQLVVLSSSSAQFIGGFTLIDYSEFGGAQYGGSTGFEIPWPPGAQWCFVHGAMSVSGHAMQVNSNIYASPGEKNWPCSLQVGNAGDREYPYRGIYADPHCIPGRSSNEGPNTQIMRVDSFFGPTSVTFQQEFHFDSPSWTSPGYHGFNLQGIGYAGYGEMIEGTLDLTASLTFTWYTFKSPPLGFDPSHGYQPPATILSSTRGGCC